MSIKVYKLAKEVIIVGIGMKFVKIVVIIITLIISIVNSTISTMVYCDIPTSAIIIEGISIVENKTLNGYVQWGSIKKELTILPNESRIDVAFNALNIRAPIRIVIGDGLVVVFRPSPVQGYTIEELRWNSSILNFNTIIVKEVLTIAKIQFIVIPPPRDVQRLAIGGEDVEYNITSDTIYLLSPVFVDPHEPLAIELQWNNGTYNAMMMLYREDVVIEGEVAGPINSFKAVIYPSIQVVEFRFTINPITSSHAMLKELKKVSVSYEISPADEFHTLTPSSTSIAYTATTIQTVTGTTTTTPTNPLQRLISTLLNNLSIVMLWIVLLVLFLLFLYAIFRSRMLLIIAFVILTIIIMVIAYGSL